MTTQTTFNLAKSDVQSYHQNGYLLVKNLIPAQACAAVNHRLQEIMKVDPPWPEQHFQRIDIPNDPRRNGKGFPGGLQRPSKVEDVFARVAMHPNLIHAMTQLLGGPVDLFTDQTLCKLGSNTSAQGGCSYYHQDSWYWKLAPERGCNCWIALDDVGVDAICLAVMPGSHRAAELIPHESYYDEPSFHDRNGQPFKRHRIPLDQVDFSREHVIPMQPGDGLFFTNYTWHRSEPNRTGRDLAAYAVAYQRKDQDAASA